MSNIIVSDETSMQAAIRSRENLYRIGNILKRAYPKNIWHVSMSDDGTVAYVTCPQITTEFGMVLHLNQIALDLETKVVRSAGELLERFNISRETGDGTVFKDIRGNAIHAPQGGV